MRNERWDEVKWQEGGGREEERARERVEGKEVVRRRMRGGSSQLENIKTEREESVIRLLHIQTPHTRNG